MTVVGIPKETLESENNFQKYQFLLTVYVKLVKTTEGRRVGEGLRSRVDSTKTQDSAFFLHGDSKSTGFGASSKMFSTITSERKEKREKRFIVRVETTVTITYKNH